MTYVHGTYNAICWLCGGKFKAKDMVLNADGKLVCKMDYDEPHAPYPSERPPDKQSVPIPQPEPEWEYVE